MLLPGQSAQGAWGVRRGSAQGAAGAPGPGGEEAESGHAAPPGWLGSGSVNQAGSSSSSGGRSIAPRSGNEPGPDGPPCAAAAPVSPATSSIEPPSPPSAGPKWAPRGASGWSASSPSVWPPGEGGRGPGRQVARWLLGRPARRPQVARRLVGRGVCRPRRGPAAPRRRPRRTQCRRPPPRAMPGSRRIGRRSERVVPGGRGEGVVDARCVGDGPRRRAGGHGEPAGEALGEREDRGRRHLGLGGPGIGRAGEIGGPRGPPAVDAPAGGIGHRLGPRHLVGYGRDRRRDGADIGGRRCRRARARPARSPPWP